MLRALRNVDEENDASEVLSPISSMDRTIKLPWLSRGRLVMLVIMALAVAALATVYARYGLSNTLSVSRSRVTISAVTQGGFVEYIPLTGNLVPKKTVYLDAIEGGQVAEVLVEEGVQVTSGQPLVKLKNSRQELEVMRLEAELTQQLNQLGTAKLSFAQATLQHDRDSIDTQAQIDQLDKRQGRRLLLRDSGAVSRADIEDGEMELARYRQLLQALKKAQAVDIELQSKQVARIEQAAGSLTANLQVARDSLASLTVRAPIAGQLTSLNVNMGESKNAGQRIGQIDALDSTKVAAQVDEFYLARVQSGQTATADIDGAAYSLQIAKVYPEVRERQFKVDLQFVEAAPATLRFGQSLQLRLEIGMDSTALQVANGPFYDNSSDGVFVLANSGDYAQRRKVKFGRRTTDAVEIISGLSPGERIVTSSYESFTGIERLRFFEGNRT